MWRDWGTAHRSLDGGAPAVELWLGMATVQARRGPGGGELKVWESLLGRVAFMVSVEGTI
jgi:hypothetical protein